MSTKSTIAYDPQDHTWHFYYECFDDDNVYLDMCGETIAIPKHVWAVIRELAPVNTDGADETDEAIEGRVRACAEERIAHYKKTGVDYKQSLDVWCAIGVDYGLASDAIEKQIECAMPAMKERRKRLRQLRERIAALRIRCEL